MWWHGELVKLRYFNNKWWQYVEVRWCIKLCWGSASVQMLNSGPTRSGLLIFTITFRLHFNPLHLLNNLLTSLLIFWTELLPSSSSDTQESQSYFFFSFFFWEVTTLSVSTLAPTVCSVFPPPLPIVSLFNYLASLFSSALITLHSLSLYFYLFFFFFHFASIQSDILSYSPSAPSPAFFRCCIPLTVRLSQKSCQDMFCCQWDAEWERIRYQPQCVPDKKQAN